MLDQARRPGSLSERIASMDRRLPATSDGVRRGVAAGFIALRAATLVQLAWALGNGSLAEASRPWLSGLAAAVFGVESVIVTVLLLRKPSPEQPTLATIDVATLCLLHVSQIWYSSPQTRAVTWDAWAFGVSTTSIILVVCLTRWRWTLLATGLVVAAYLGSVGPSALDRGQMTTVGANAFGYVSSVVVSRWGWQYLMRLAKRADDASTRADRAQRRLQTRQHQLAHELHEQTGGVLAFLEDLDLERLQADPDELARITERLSELALRARAVLDEERQSTAADTLGAVARLAARSQAGRLHVTCSTDSVDNLRLDAQALAALQRAVESLLSNVARHAAVREATVYARCDRKSFEVSVTDVGIGFDPQSVTRGFGLMHVAGNDLRHYGFSVHIQSAPGEGTCVTITGPIHPRLRSV